MSSGYRPLVTRRTYGTAAGTVVPVDLAPRPRDAHTPHEPPPAGFSNWEEYEDVEVLLRDHSGLPAEQCYPLPATLPLGPDALAFVVRFAAGAGEG